MGGAGGNSLTDNDRTEAKGHSKGSGYKPAVQIRLTVGETRGSVRPWPGPPGLLQRCEMYMK